MSDQTPVMREKYKNMLRRRVVTEPSEAGEEEFQDVKKDVQRYYLRRILILLVILAAVAVTVWVARFLEEGKLYTSLEVLREEAGGAEGSRYEAFGGSLIRYSSDGLAYLDRSGRTVWDYGCTMKEPIIAINGNYGVLGDRQSQSAVIFDLQGVTGTVTTTMPLLNLTISAHGVVALMLDDVDASVIQFYDRTGLKLDITVKNVLASTSGYPMDLSLSPTGTGLMLSLIYLDQGSMQSRIAFLNFDVGKSSSDRVVGLFPYGEALFPQVEYLSDTAAVAFGDRQLEFYSLKNEASPELVTSVPCDSEVHSVFTGNGQVGVILNGENGRYQLRVYNASGGLLMARDIPFEYTRAEFNGDYLAFYDSGEALILSPKGKVKYQGALDGTASRLFFLNRNTFLQFGAQMTKEIRLK